jgi:DNA anti-recombination protein RmuC
MKYSLATIAALGLLAACGNNPDAAVDKSNEQNADGTATVAPATGPTIDTSQPVSEQLEQQADAVRDSAEQQAEAIEQNAEQMSQQAEKSAEQVKERADQAAEALEKEAEKAE